MKYLLITGGTGLLGEYLLRDLTLRDRPLAVVARGSGRRSAEQRVEAIYAKLERSERRSLRRPIVLEGDLRQPRLGLDRQAVRWVADSCDTLLHNAASLQFIEDPKTGEPYRSNVDGTTHMLELLEAAGIRRLHHVSTAYVCGRRRGRVMEADPLDPAAAGNDYESSKIRSEQLVRGFKPLDSLTVYRPGIIVGDHRSGYTSTYHGFYVPLQLCYTMCMATAGSRGLPQGLLLSALGLSGEEQKNFVPVDWVGEIIARGVSDTRGEFDGETIHLTPRRRVSVAEMTGAIVEALAELPQTPRRAAASQGQKPEQLLSFFEQQMKVYEAYWRDDPVFDTATTDRLAPGSPCPSVSGVVMKRLCGYAIKTNFGSRRTPLAEPKARLGDTSLPIDLRSAQSLPPAEQRDAVGVCVTGPGGADAWFRLAGGEPVRLGRGAPAEPSLQLRMNRATLDALVTNELTVAEALSRGRVAAFGPPGCPPGESLVADAAEAFVGEVRRFGWQPNEGQRGDEPKVLSPKQPSPSERVEPQGAAT